MRSQRWVAVPVFIWIGLLCAISFMEAWLKFQAPGVSMAIGLGIGKLVFSALNKMEWMAALMSVLLLMYAKQWRARKNWDVVVVLMVLVLQTVWLLPLLDARAELVIEGKAVATSYMHFYYVAGEVIKVILLIGIGLRVLEVKSGPLKKKIE